MLEDVSLDTHGQALGAGLVHPEAVRLHRLGVVEAEGLAQPLAHRRTQQVCIAKHLRPQCLEMRADVSGIVVRERERERESQTGGE